MSYGEIDLALTDLWIDQQIDLGKADDVHVDWITATDVDVHLTHGVSATVTHLMQDKDASKWVQKKR